MPALLTGPAAAPAAADDLYATALVDGSLVIYPPAGGEKSALIDQAYSEYRDLCNAGVEVDPDAFCARFPDYQTSLRRLVEVHRELEVNPDLLRKLDRWPSPGQTFYNFRLEEELGRGAFARVFLAREPGVGNRQVAVKVTMNRDDDEVGTLGKLRHPNVVPILYAPPGGENNGFSMVCMPFLGRATLLSAIENLVGRKRLPDRADALLAVARDDRWTAESAAPPTRAFRHGSYLEGVVYVGERLASALAYVHERGVLHRDLKPSNVLLCPNGEPMLIDFNLAHDRSITEYRMGGTLPYMPPEQLEFLGQHKKGERIVADNRSDLYALGVILYELLTGAHPFGPAPLKLKASEAREFLLEQQRRGPKPLRSFNRDMDPAVELVILRCLSHDPARRPATARELAAELRRLPTLKWRARRWLVAHAHAAAIAAVLVGSAGAAGAVHIVNQPTHAQKAERLYKEGKHIEAIKEFDQALADNDNQPPLHFARGRAHMKRGQLTAAVEDFKKANPDTDGRTMACLGYCCSLLNGQPWEIEKYYRAAIKAGYADAAVLNNLAFCVYSSNTQNPDKCLEAEAFTTEALEKSPGLIAANYNRAAARLAAWYATHDSGLAVDGLEDIRVVINQNVTTANAYRCAADLCAAVLSDRLGDPKVDPLFAEGANYLRLAVQNGYPRGALRTQFPRTKCVAEWASQLPADLNAETDRTSPDLNVRMVDPVRD
jgi:serine/threonine protein kinase/Flp pilus assembly protein TadD